LPVKEEEQSGLEEVLLVYQEDGQLSILYSSVSTVK